ncbi:MAG: hypothetical protein A3F18_05135 [Legionellales bacterium RIFCSPHIGHO2_12_FULL_37_14]|nr:MAG: hypothetical protein A3F18_05135 [Legionellales bacterium RIFCSPHIGHO2_12_FULL_37_14]
MQLKLYGKKIWLYRQAIDFRCAIDGLVGLIKVKSHTRNKKTKGRLIDLSSLPRRKVYNDLPEAEKVCACCSKPLRRIGEDISEQVEVLPQPYS